MPSSTTPGSPIIDSSRAAMSTWPSPRVDRLGTPNAPAIRFARAMTFVASWFTHLLRPARLLAPRYGSDHLRGQRGLLLPGFQRDEPVAGYNYNSDWTPLLAGLSPARMAASLAAPEPYVRLARIRLPPRVSDGKAIARPRMEDDRFREPGIHELRDPLPRDP